MKELFSATYSIPYLIIAFILIAFTLYEYRYSTNVKKIQKIKRIDVFLLISFIALRGYVGWDWIGYHETFQTIPSLFNGFSFELMYKNFEYTEPGFLLYVSIFKIFSDSFTLFTIISSLVDILAFNYIFRKYSNNYSLSCLILFSLQLPLFFDLMRNIKAVICFLLSLKYLSEKKYLIVIFFSFLGFSFHSSYLLFVPFYLFCNLILPKKGLLFIFIITNIIFIFNISITSYLLNSAMNLFGGSIAYKLNVYATSEYYSQAVGITFGYLNRNLIFLLLIYLYDYIDKDRFKYVINMYIIYFITTVGMTDFEIIMQRCELIYGISLCLIWPILIDYIKYIRYPRVRTTLICYLLLFSLLKIYNTTSNVMYDYENNLLGAKKYEERYMEYGKYTSMLMDKYLKE